MISTPATIELVRATADDLEPMTQIRILAMRESLERIGRFDMERARSYFAAGFDPAFMWRIEANGALAGCVTVRPDPEGDDWIEYFYVHPDFQGQGIGAEVMRRLADAADREGRVLRLEVLRESDGASRFYERFGFAETHRLVFDIVYRRDPTSLTRR